MLVIPSVAQDYIISCNYDGTGLEWVDLFDNPVLGWIVDETKIGVGVIALAKPAPPIAEVPILVGSLPPGAPDTAPVLSPQWAHVSEGVFVPDMWRGALPDFFTWIATNNGANRLLRGNFVNARLQLAMRRWSERFPDQFNPAPFE